MKMAKSSTSNLSIVGQTPPRSPGRHALAAAIESHAEAMLTLENNRRGSETALHFRIEARKALEDAHATLNNAKEARIQYFKNAACGLTDLEPVSVKDARETAATAQETLDNMISVDQALTAECPALEQSVSMAEFALSNAIRNVVKSDPAVDQLLTDFVELHRKFIDMKRIIQFLDIKSMIPDQYAHILAEKPWPELNSLQAWKAAIAALATDSDAMLPIKKIEI